MSEKAFGYLRVSTKAQAANGRDGFPRQRAVIAAYAKAHGLTLAEEFKDTGVPGKTAAEDRPGLADLFGRLADNGVRLVLVETADRLARDLMVSEIILAQFRDLGVRVVACDSDTDLTVGEEDATRVLIRQVLGAVAQFEKTRIVVKLRAARNRKRKETGRCEGIKPYGDLPGEAEILARMKQLYRKPANRPRLSYGRIAKALDAEGLKPRLAERWSSMAVRNILLRG